ncbi:MAG: hypothetical protein WCC67_21785 [Candidatus Acidiferrales bacterium]|jgi:hypothetical protein
MPAIVVVLMFLVLFLVMFLGVLLGPFVGMGFAIWKQGKDSSGTRAGSGSEPQVCK